MPAVSVIVPVYRVEAYLRQCVDSILKQSFRDFELILVDDGSPDTCPQICDEYALADPRVRVIHKENGGLSSARNAGIESASGDYVLFVDSDDWLGKDDAIERLVERVGLSGADLLSFAYRKIWQESGKTVSCLEHAEPMPLSFQTREEKADYLSERGLYIASACNKLISLRLLMDQKLFFAEGETSEDVVWCLRLLLAAESPDYLNENLYCYRQRAGSISQTLSLEKCRQLCEQILKCVELCEDSAELKNACRRYTAYQLAAFMKVQTFAESYPEDCVTALAPYAWLLKYHCGNRKLRVLNGMTRLMGFPMSCKLLYRVYNLRHGA